MRTVKAPVRRLSRPRPRGRWGRLAVATIVVCAGIAATEWSPSSVAVADPGPSCPLALVLMCRMLPVAPDLDEDVDLTQPTPPPPVGDVVEPPADPNSS